MTGWDLLAFVVGGATAAGCWLWGFWCGVVHGAPAWRRLALARQAARQAAAKE